MNEIIVSEKIKLKPLAEADAQDIFQTIDNEREYLGKWLPFVAFTKTVDDTLSFIRTNKNTPDETEKLYFAFISERNLQDLSD